MPCALIPHSAFRIPKPATMRLDAWLTEHELFPSRTRARQAIEAGVVRVNGAVVTKPSLLITTDDRVEADTRIFRYVSRGGYKLEKAIRDFGLDFLHKVVLDVGASTGGFTDCALQHGAQKVYAVDVGAGQLHDSLATNPRVTSLENTDIRNVTPEMLGEQADWIAVDASFISLRHILPVLPALLAPGGGVVALVKPQFEQAERKRFSGGVIRDERVRRQTLEQVERYATVAGFHVQDMTPTDAEEGKNQEFLLWLIRTP